MIDFAVMNQLLFEGRHHEVRAMAEAAIASGLPANTVLDDGLIAGMRVVGEDFKYNRIFVPEVLLAARAMKSGMEVLRPLLANREDAGGCGTVVIGTVKGDLHDIGKNLVGMMAEGSGFKIVDLGTGISAEQFVQAAAEHDAEIIGMSALLTTTMIYMKTVVDAVRAGGLDAKIAVGGAPVTQKFADEVGADGYAADASSSVELFKRLVAERKQARAR